MIITGVALSVVVVVAIASCESCHGLQTAWKRT